MAESVTVSGVTPIIETGRSQVSSTVDETAVQNLPVNGRNFIDFALLTPGVTRDTRTGDISFAGQRGTLNSLVIDGADNNNTFFGRAPAAPVRAARRTIQPGRGAGVPGQLELVLRRIRPRRRRA